jgi:hypothetical protein
MLILVHAPSGLELRFINAMGSLSGGTLDQNAQAFNPSEVPSLSRTIRSIRR